VPYKHNESRRHKFTKPKYKVTNWPEYNDALRQRGDITIWFTEEAMEQWHPVKQGARGRPQVYADHAIVQRVFSLAAAARRR
jgi:Transposase DDE domain